MSFNEIFDDFSLFWFSAEKLVKKLICRKIPNNKISFISIKQNLYPLVAVANRKARTYAKTISKSNQKVS